MEINVNATITGGTQPRISSYYSNSTLGMIPGEAATAKVKDLLTPFAANLLPGAIDGYTLPVSDGTEGNRANIRTATKLLEDAGWTVQDGTLKNAAGEPFAFEILLVQ